MHPFHEYLCGKLDALLKKRGIVVFYDPRREFELFFDRELKETSIDCAGLPRVPVNGRLTFIVRYEGSFLALRNAVEPIADLDKPEPLIVYLPGVERDRQTSVLMELEKSGAPYEPQLKRLALNVLRRRFTDVQIDEMLRPPSVGYDDVVSLLRQQQEGTSPSVFRTIFEGARSEALIARWLADEGEDATIVAKGAAEELFKLIEARLGLPIPESISLTETREKVLRYVLVGEFRSDLECDPPQSIAMVPEPPSKDHVERIRDVAESLRRGDSNHYVPLAIKVEADLGLAKAKIDALHLGRIDTFRFEERALLRYADELVCAREYKKALGIVADRNRSFWVDRDVGRKAQWKACRLTAELGREIEKVRPALSKNNGNPSRWVQSYSREDGWFRVDALHRRLETWVAKMDDDPETENGLAVVRREHEELLKKMAAGFAKVFGQAAWTVPGALHQTRIYPDIVQTMGGRVAYFFVDAMRFEMGVALARQLEGTKDLTIRTAIAAMPTITPVGMAALLPGASASFSVVERKGKVAARIEGTEMSDLSERLKFLKAKVPDAVDIALGMLLKTSSTELSIAIADASLVIVRSQELDALGENVDELTARTAMAGVIDNVARAIRKLSSAGVENFVVTSDHGHQFSLRKEDDMKTDNPGGATVDIHRRCWMGRGGTTPSGTVRVSGAELGYDTNLDFVFPTGLGVFKAGGSLSYHHGGLSLQEVLVPVLSFRLATQQPRRASRPEVVLSNVPSVIANRTFEVRVVLRVDPAMAESSASPDLSFRICLIGSNEQVGSAGLARGATISNETGLVTLSPGSDAVIAMILMDDTCTSLRVVVIEPRTDAVLTQSEEVAVKLGV